MLRNRNIRVLFAISFLQGLVFYASIATLYRRAVGISMFQITLIESISLLLSLALEVPWGLAADRIGYRRTSILCHVLFAVSKVVFWKADDFAGFLLERILLAVVTAGLSGVTESIMVSSCRNEDMHRVFGWNHALGMLGMMCASMTYSLSIGENYRMAAFLTVISYGLAAALSFFLKETKVSGIQEKNIFRSFSKLFRGVVRMRGLMLLVLAGAVFGECVQLITVFFNQLQYERCGMPAEWIGIIHMLGTAVWLSSAASAWCAKRLGKRKLGVVVFVGGAAACMMLSLTQNRWLSVACVLALCLCGALVSPMLEEMKNRLIQNQNRATMLSVTSLFANGTAVVIELFAGHMADGSLPGAMLLCAGLCLTALGLFVAAETA